MARGTRKIGTTGRGIGPAYEDKVSRHGLRLADLADPERLEDKLGSVIEYHNFLLEHFYKTDPVDGAEIADQAAQLGEELKPMFTDVTSDLHALRDNGGKILYEGAQGSLPRYRSRYLSLRDLVQHYRWRRIDRCRRRSRCDRLCAGNYQGLHHPCGQWTVSDRIE